MDPSRVYALDVECVASGTTHTARTVAQIGIVNYDNSIQFNQYVKPDVPVVSCLTELTGVTMEHLEKYGVPFDVAMQSVRRFLPKDAVLVGHGVGHDVEWLGLVEGVDFASLVDLAGLTRAWNPKFNSYTVFSQDHIVKNLLGWNLATTHDAVGDAIKSLNVYWRYKQLEADPEGRKAADELLLNAPRTPGFSVLHPTYEGVCMGNRRKCTCGDVFILG